MAVPPLIVTGMHRSGTSATARLLQHAGLDVGGRLLGPGLDNPTGYYEDLDFCALNLALVSAGVGDDPRYQPDWAHAERLVPARLERLRGPAQALVAERAARGTPWGFKDPRTAVLLDFYESLAPDARYLFVYREPWDVLASLLRTQLRPLQGRACVAVRTWITYNTRLLDFRERHPERTTLVHVDAVATDPTAVLELVARRAGESTWAPTPTAVAKLEAGPGTFDAGLLRRTDADGPLAQLLAETHPEAQALYERLDAAADLPGIPPRDDDGALTPVALRNGTGRLGVGAVMVRGEGDNLDDATVVARAAPAGDAARAADLAVQEVPGQLVAVVFDGHLRPDALALGVEALREDDGLSAVLFGAGRRELGQAVGHDPLAGDGTDPGAAILVRREDWLAARGFAGGAPAVGAEAWTFAVGCLARGGRVARVGQAVHLHRVDCDEPGARRRVMARHPELAARRRLDAELRAQTRAAKLRAATAESERDKLLAQLEAQRASRPRRLRSRRADPLR